MTKNIPEFSANDVMSFNGFTIKCSDFQSILESIAENQYFARSFHDYLKEHSVNISNESRDIWGHGVECETLKLGDPAWRDGKVKLRLCLEFIPNESAKPTESVDSPLDEIRQMT
jgi:hypothetical protein